MEDFTFFKGPLILGSASVESLFGGTCLDMRLNILRRPCIEGDAGGLGEGKGTSGGSWKTERFGCCSYTLASTSPVLDDCGSSSPACPNAFVRNFSALLTLDHITS